MQWLKNESHELARETRRSKVAFFLDGGADVNMCPASASGIPRSQILGDRDA